MEIHVDSRSSSRPVFAEGSIPWLGTMTILAWGSASGTPGHRWRSYPWA